MRNRFAKPRRPGNPLIYSASAGQSALGLGFAFAGQFFELEKSESDHEIPTGGVQCFVGWRSR